VKGVKVALKPELIRAIQVAARTGVIEYGAREVKELVLHGNAKAVIVAKNSPPELRRDIEYYARLSSIPVLVFDGTSIELGTIIGRPHSVTVLAIINPGQSNILDLARQVSASEQSQS
jgi:large subunit ribosomal protein L30e